MIMRYQIFRLILHPLTGDGFNPCPKGRTRREWFPVYGHVYNTKAYADKIAEALGGQDGKTYESRALGRDGVRFEAYRDGALVASAATEHELRAILLRDGND